MRNHSFFLVLMTLLFTLPAFAETPVDIGFYGRTGFQIGKGGAKGERIDQTAGFAATTRLLENQYFEFSAKAKLSNEAHFKFTMANGGESFHYNNTWVNEGIAIRDLYLEVGKLPENQRVGLWLGSRMYRGDDIYLFDTWPLDNQNFLGGGVSYTDGNTIELAFGAKNDSPYTAVADGPTYQYSTQRFILINKITHPMADGRKFKTNLEFNYLPKSEGKLTQGATVSSVESPSTVGLMAGVQLGYLPGHNAYLNYGYGDVVSGSGILEGPAYNVNSVVTTSGAVLTDPGLKSRKKSHLLTFAAGGSEEGARLSGGLLYGLVARVYKPGNSSTMGISTTASVRPMYYVTDHVHAGVQLDGVVYAKKISDNDVNFLQFAPMVEYALNKNVFGSPKLRLIASNVLYSKAVEHYGMWSRYAFNVATGIEVWF